MHPRLHIGILIQPAPAIIALLVIAFGAFLLVSSVFLLLLAWLEAFFLTAPLVAILLVGSGLVLVGWCLRLLHAGYRRYLAP